MRHVHALLSRVSFAPGPLATADGHPTHEGVQTARKVRELGNDWGRSLTPEHVRALQQELGPENAASVERLKRRSAPHALSWFHDTWCTEAIGVRRPANAAHATPVVPVFSFISSLHL